LDWTFHTEGSNENVDGMGDLRIALKQLGVGYAAYYVFIPTVHSCYLLKNE
jgi:hypothetical protein